MVKGLKLKDMNSLLKNNSVKVILLPGGTLKQLHHYVVPKLNDDRPDTIIIQGGCKDVSNKNSNTKDIVKS